MPETTKRRGFMNAIIVLTTALWSGLLTLGMIRDSTFSGILGLFIGGVTAVLFLRKKIHVLWAVVGSILISFLLTFALVFLSSFL